LLPLDIEISFLYFLSLLLTSFLADIVYQIFLNRHFFYSSTFFDKKFHFHIFLLLLTSSFILCKLLANFNFIDWTVTIYFNIEKEIKYISLSSFSDSKSRIIWYSICLLSAKCSTYMFQKDWQKFPSLNFHLISLNFRALKLTFFHLKNC